MNTGWKNVLDNNGIGISFTGMSIVFTALIVIGIAITLMPFLLNLLAVYFPEKSDPYAIETVESTVQDEDLVAAIGYTLHRVISKQNRFD